MSNWFTRLFKADPIPPTDSVGVYRKPGKPVVTPPVARPPKTPATLFERPAESPPIVPVQVVAPTTEADNYRWLDFGTPVQPVVITPPPLAPVVTPSRYAASGSMANMSGSFMCLTGMAMSRMSDWCWGTGSIIVPQKSLDKPTSLTHSDSDPTLPS